MLLGGGKAWEVISTVGVESIEAGYHHPEPESGQVRAHYNRAQDDGHEVGELKRA